MLMMHSNDWFYLVCSVVPLLSMSNSVLLCISTLLESGNHYSKMFELTDNLGRKLFECISITLVCGTLCTCPHVPHWTHILRACVADDCLLTDQPEKCTHKLAE